MENRMAKGRKMSDSHNKSRTLSRRAFLQAMAVGAGGTVLASCALPAAPVAGPAAGDAAPAEETTSVIYWSMFGLEEAEQADAQVARFNEETGMDAVFVSIGWGNVAQKAQVAIEGGNPPDMVSLWDQAYTWGPRGLLQPLESYAERDGFDGEGWSPAAWQNLWSEGHMWGTGHTLNVHALHANLGMLEEAGYSADSPPQTFSDLDVMAEALTEWDDDGNITRLGFLPWINTGSPWHWGWSNGATFYDEETDTITANQDEGLLEVLDWYITYAEKYDIEKIDRFRSGFEGQSALTADPWYAAKIGMQMDGAWKRSWIPRYAPDLEYTVFKSPHGPRETEPISLVQIGAMFNVPTGAKNPEGGWQLAKFMAGPQQQIEFGQLVGDVPPLTSAARSPEFLDAYPFNELFVELTEGTSGRWFPTVPVLSMYKTELDRVVDEVIHGKAEPQQALDELTAKVQKELDDFREQTA